MKNKEIKKKDEKNKVIKKDDDKKLDTIDKKSATKSSMGIKGKFILLSLLILAFLIASLLFAVKFFSVDTDHQVTYEEKSNVDYKVYLKPNDFYETEYLNKNMIYVASLIDKIQVDFNYTFDISEISNIDYDYDVIGTLVITDFEGKNTFFQKEYELAKSTTGKMTDSKHHAINKRVNIRYNYYNSLANKFRSNYGIDTNSNLIVKLRIHENNAKNNDFKLNNNSEMSLTIPLSEKAVNIKMDYKEVNKKKQLYKNVSAVIKNYLYLAVSVGFLIAAIITWIPYRKVIIKLSHTKSPYDKYVGKLLKEYDRLIVETTSAPQTDHKNIVNVTSFNELLDVRDNLNLPIKYYIITEHQKCSFYINHEDELYILIVKAIDLEENKK